MRKIKIVCFLLGIIIVIGSCNSENDRVITDTKNLNQILTPVPFNEVTLFITLNKSSTVQASLFDIKGVKVIDVFKRNNL